MGYRISVIGILLLCLYAMPTAAQVSVSEDATLSGKVYSDYYWMAQHHNENIEGKNGFWFRRIYATYNHDLNESFSTQLRLEMNSSGDFVTNTEMTPTVKDAYLKWSNGTHEIYAGISGTPMFGLTEDVWGYRSVEKSPQDLYDFSSSRDFGLAAKGKLGSAEKVQYHLSLGNGNSNRPDIDKGKKVSLSMAYYFTDKLVVEGYTDYNSQTNRADSYSAQVFGGYQSDDLNIGALYSNQYHEGTLGGRSRNLDLVSVFSNFSITEKAKGYLRVDHLFDGYQGGRNNSYIPFAEEVESTFMVAGADFLLAEKIHLMPNVEAVVYGENAQGLSPDTDIIPRMTLYWEF
ncbi:hypothetical protein [Fodinibius sp. Rm-B-1B1-1]|uniref:hypothetical protein n=1 Tax=Fodinibius alkaliphilus TaxID=3140241 RepID=UPI00315B04B9